MRVRMERSEVGFIGKITSPGSTHGMIWLLGNEVPGAYGVAVWTYGADVTAGFSYDFPFCDPDRIRRSY